MNDLSSRARVLTALDHREADRVPIDLDGMRSSGIHAVAYNRLKEHLGMTGGETVVYDIMQQLAHPEPAVLDRFGVDTRPLARAPIGLDPARPAWKPWILPDGSPAVVPDGLNPRQTPEGYLELLDDEGHVTYRMPPSGLYFDPVYEPLADATTVADVEAYAPSEISDAELSWLRGEAQRLRAANDKAILGLTGINLYERAQRARGWQRFMTDLGSEPALAEAILQRLTEAGLRTLDRYIAAVGEYIDIIQLGDDLGTQAGPQISPRMYRRLIKPFHQRLFQFARRRSGKPVMLHCCGGIYPLIPDLIEAGVDILNPVQFTAAGMDPVRLKAQFGRDIVFWGGGADTQQVLVNASPDEVRAHVRAQIEVFAPGGGFVFNQVHNLQASVPPENVVAMFDAARTYGGYR
ncbi:MAG TPA: uroporphyrinogen decarboxylase family protein [Anaerolineae bacterium]